MAMVFMGASYSGRDMTDDFVKVGGAFIGYDEKGSEPLYVMLKEIQVGDFVVLKGNSPSYGLFIKAVGICRSNRMIYTKDLNNGREVQWFWKGNEKFGRYDDHFNNMRSGTIYVEKNEEILLRVLNLLKLPEATPF